MGQYGMGGPTFEKVNKKATALRFDGFVAFKKKKKKASEPNILGWAKMLEQTAQLRTILIQKKKKKILYFIALLFRTTRENKEKKLKEHTIHATFLSKFSALIRVFLFH